MFSSVATHTIPTKTLYKRQDHEADATTSTPSSSSSQLPSSTSTDSSGESAWFGNNWAWQRWSIFAIFILVILFAVIGTIRANAARARRGRRPITGTSWFTPPSYLQSERQYNYDDGTRVDRRNRDNNGANGEEYVPQYTEEVNPDDMGYYDDKGLFHVNSKALPLPPPPELDQNLSGADAHGNSHGFTGSGLIRDGYDYYNNSRLNASQNGTGDSHNVSEQLESLSLTSPENAMIRQRAREQYYSLGGTSAANSGSGTSNSNSGLANGNSLARESIEMARISNAVNDNNGSNNADELVHNDDSNNNRRPRLSVQEQVVQARNLQHKGHV